MKNSFLRKILPFLTAAVLLTGCAAGNGSHKDNIHAGAGDPQVTDPGVSQPSEVLSERQKNWIADIDEVLRPTLLSTPGVTEFLSADTIAARLDALLQTVHAGEASDYELCLELLELLSEIRIAHLTLSVPASAYDQVYFIPTGGQWFADGFYLVNVASNLPELLGCRLLALNGHPLDDLLSSFDRVLINETENGLKAGFENNNCYGFATDELVYLGLADSLTAPVTITYETDLHEEKTIEVSPVLMTDSYFDELLLLYSYAEKLPYGLQFYFENGMPPFQYALHSEEHVLYLQYNECQDATTMGLGSGYPDFASFFDGMMEELRGESTIDTLIIDLRNNGGGNELLWNGVMEKYHEELSKYTIKLLIGKATFSAAVDCVDTTLSYFPNAILYGEENGQYLHNYTDIRFVELPRTGCVLYVPTHEDAIRVLTTRYEDLHRGILPDVEVVQTYQDMLDGIDTVYEAAIAE